MDSGPLGGGGGQRVRNKQGKAVGKAAISSPTHPATFTEVQTYLRMAKEHLDVASDVSVRNLEKYKDMERRSNQVVMVAIGSNEMARKKKNEEDDNLLHSLAQKVHEYLNECMVRSVNKKETAQSLTEVCNDTCSILEGSNRVCSVGQAGCAAIKCKGQEVSPIQGVGSIRFAVEAEDIAATVRKTLANIFEHKKGQAERCSNLAANMKRMVAEGTRLKQEVVKKREEEEALMLNEVAEKVNKIGDEIIEAEERRKEFKNNMLNFLRNVDEDGAQDLMMGRDPPQDFEAAHHPVSMLPPKTLLKHGQVSRNATGTKQPNFTPRPQSTDPPKMMGHAPGPGQSHLPMDVNSGFQEYT